jgi:hypothetical protein
VNHEGPRYIYDGADGEGFGGAWVFTLMLMAVSYLVSVVIDLLRPALELIDWVLSGFHTAFPFAAPTSAADVGHGFVLFFGVLAGLAVSGAILAMFIFWAGRKVAKAASKS